jgi:hypothetical protein
MKQTLKMRVLSGITAVMTVGSIILPASFAKAASPTSVSDTLSREKITTSSTHLLVATLPAFANTQTVTFSYAVATTGLETSTPSCALGTGTCTASASGNTLTVTCTAVGGCSGVLTLGTFVGSNEGTAGSKTVTIAGSGGVSGSFAIPLVDEDQVSVTASVDPTITFDIDTAPTDTESAIAYSVSLGTLDTSSVKRSDATINSIWIDLATNAKGGAVVTVTSTKASLKSTSVPTDAIDSTTASMAAGTENYGLCVAQSTETTGGPFAENAPFNGATCVDGAVNTVGTLNAASAQTILNSTSLPLSGGRAKIRVNAAISSITPAHNDYADTLTFIATGTF